MSDGENATPGQSDPGSGETSGHHAEGIAVADLLAKLTGDQRINPVNRRSVDVTAPGDDATVPLPVGAPPDEIPDLAALARARRPLAAHRHPPVAPPPASPPPSRRHRGLIAGRAAAAIIAVCALAITGAA
ncbi:MAG: hypothetical protein ACR2JM_13745, partial [Mycobacterium sp.]